MAAPQMKAEVAVDWVGNNTRCISLWGTPDALAEMHRFGEMHQNHPGNDPSHWYLTVDPRFDFDEVLAYINTYGVQP